MRRISGCLSNDHNFEIFHALNIVQAFCTKCGKVIVLWTNPAHLPVIRYTEKNVSGYCSKCGNNDLECRCAGGPTKVTKETI